MLFSCKEDSTENNYVKINANHFTLKGAKFFPIIMNYKPAFRFVENELLLCPSLEYDLIDKFDAFTKDDVNQRLKAHFQGIKELGFNSIRLVGYNELYYDLFYPEAAFGAFSDDGSLFYFNINEQREGIEKSIKNLLKIAEDEGLKVLITFPQPTKKEYPNYERLKYIGNTLDALKDQPSLFAYDFFNEPLYFDNQEYTKVDDIERRKEIAFEIVNSWKSLMREKAPNQLFTISFAEPLEVFEWDPELLPVDFISFHSYNPLRLPNEVYWFEKYTSKPWILSETSLPADNDSISYAEQEMFLKESFKRVVDCGGSGYGWWQFQEVFWGHFEHDFTGMFNHNGITYTKKDSLPIFGTSKVANAIFKNLSLEPEKDKCHCFINYYNIYGYENFLLELYIKDLNGNPIEGAVIRGWNSDWSIGSNSFSDSSGKFRLFSNQKIAHFEISAPLMTKLKFDFEPNYIAVDSANTALENEDLEYQNIQFRKFLKNPNLLPEGIFEFDPDKFNRYKYKTEMKTLYLEKIILPIDKIK